MVVHSHQPVGNFDHVIEEAYQQAYAPFLSVLALHSRIRVSLHYSGILLEWLEGHHPEFFQRLRQLVESGQVELVGGGYFEPILPAIPDGDKVAQVRRMSDYLRGRFGVTPRGAWLAERVWEPSLARPLAESGVEYTVLDDTHFLAAGLEPSELHDYYITEEAGMPLRIVPSLKALRYTMPFREPEETLRILHEGTSGPAALFAVGDDCEKFGVWPGTFQHCYTHGWLERFLQAIEEAGDWLETTTISDFLQANSSRGRIYLPTASYPEMMEWALPVAASREFKACLEQSQRMPNGERLRRFLLGGLWRNFLSKYPESNQLHKLMLEVSRRWHHLSLARAAGTEGARLLSEAQTHLLAGQCNDAYWHGTFGGLYAPHLRGALLHHLIKAEAVLDQLEGAPRNSVASAVTRDFDTDGQEEVLIEHPIFGMVVRPADGGTVSSLRFKPADFELINSLMRRPEPYHDLVRQHATSNEPSHEGLASIHERVSSKETNLDALLHYDRYARHAFRTYVFSVSKEWQDFDNLRLEENEELAQGPWALGSTQNPAGALRLEREARFEAGKGQVALRVAKTIRTQVVGTIWQIECRSSLLTDHAISAPLALGVELVFNLEAANAPDRYLLTSSGSREIRQPLEFRGEIEAPRLLLVDEWRHLQISLTTRPHARWWVVPVETISQSESGFERVYQGSAILAVWKVDRSPWRKITRVIRAEIG